MLPEESLNQPNPPNMSTDQTTISIARGEHEKQAIYRLYYETYIEELGYLFPANHENRTLTDQLDETARHYVAKDNRGNPIGTYRINQFCELSDPADQLKPLPVTELLNRAPREALSYTSRLIVRKEWRGSSLLAKMADHFATELVKHGIRFDTCISLPHLVAFYEQLGYQRYAERGIDHNARLEFPMAMAVQNKHHFLRTRSLLSRNQAITKCVDHWGDGQWLRQLIQPWGTNHRLMGVEEFWSIAGDALLGRDATAGGLFRDLSQDRAKRILKRLPILDIKAGDQILHAGLHQENLFVVLQGEFTAKQTQKGTSQQSKPLEAGDHFGSQEFLRPDIGKFDVIAKRDSKIIVLDQAFIKKTRKNDPEAADIIINNINQQEII
jgi:predicted GNAT family N-acyltransferase